MFDLPGQAHQGPSSALGQVALMKHLQRLFGQEGRSQPGIIRPPVVMKPPRLVRPAGPGFVGGPRPFTGPGGPGFAGSGMPYFPGPGGPGGAYDGSPANVGSLDQNFLTGMASRPSPIPGPAMDPAIMAGIGAQPAPLVGDGNNENQMRQAILRELLGRMSGISGGTGFRR